MDSSPQPSVADALNAQSFVNTIQTSGNDIWGKSNSVNFLVFMVIGFCVTLAVIALAVLAFWAFVRRRRLRRIAEELDAELAVTVLEPKELFVVIHPGGAADVAFKEDEDKERQFVLKHKPIELSMACIDVDGDTIPAYRDCSKATAPNEESSRKDEQALGGSRLPTSSALEVEDTARFLHAGRRPYYQFGARVAETTSLGYRQFASTSVHMSDGERSAAEGLDVDEGGASRTDGNISARTTASDEYHEDVLLLQQRFSGKKW